MFYMRISRTQVKVDYFYESVDKLHNKISYFIEFVDVVCVMIVFKLQHHPGLLRLYESKRRPDLGWLPHRPFKSSTNFKKHLVVIGGVQINLLPN